VNELGHPIRSFDRRRRRHRARLNSTAEDLRPRLVAASLVAAFRALDKGSEAAAADIAGDIDVVFAFLRGGLEALTSKR
jgi:hypothetical protein